MPLKRIWIHLAYVLALLLSSCTGISSSQLIASNPRNTPIAVYPDKGVVIYRAYFELKVKNVDHSADQAIRIGYDHGGYLVSSQSWWADGRKNIILVLAVPTANFDRTRLALLRLGYLISESVSGELVTTPYTEPTFSHITLQLRPGGIRLPSPSIDPPGWDPGHTFQRAFSVFLSVFGFLADILIWAIVVVGPFLLIGWLLWLLVRRLRR